MIHARGRRIDSRSQPQWLLAVLMSAGTFALASMFPSPSFAFQADISIFYVATIPKAITTTTIVQQPTGNRLFQLKQNRRSRQHTSSFLLQVATTSPSTSYSTASVRSVSDTVNSNQHQLQQQQQQRTLYDILGASMTDTRAEIKKKYVQLAKQSHPDAMLGATSAGTSGEVAVVLDFNEIATAYQILSDPKQRLRYDRSLKAADLTENIAAFCLKAVSEPVKNLAWPFLRRTTATTLSAYQAAVGTVATTTGTSTSNRSIDNSESPPKNDFSKTWETALQAAATTSKVLDAQEWQQQSNVLQDQAVAEYKRAVALRQDLQHAATERLKLALHTAQSGLTAAEATILLESFQNATLATSATTTTTTADGTMSQTEAVTNDNMRENVGRSIVEERKSNSNGPSIWQRLNFLRMSVEKEIDVLEQIEISFLAHQQQDTMAQESFQTAVRDRLLAHTAFLQAQAKETAARAVYDAAVQHSLSKKQALDAIVLDLYQIEHAAAVSSTELERLQSAVQHQSETVRIAMCRKERAIHKGQMQQQPHVDDTDLDDSHNIFPDTLVSDAVNAVRLETLAAQRQRERDMAAMADSVELAAAKLLSQANKLKQKR